MARKRSTGQETAQVVRVCDVSDSPKLTSWKSGGGGQCPTAGDANDLSGCARCFFRWACPRCIVDKRTLCVCSQSCTERYGDGDSGGERSHHVQDC